MIVSKGFKGARGGSCFFLFLVLVATCACAGPFVGMSPTSTVIPSPTPSVTPTPSFTPTATYTPSPTPTETSTPTPLPLQAEVDLEQSEVMQGRTTVVWVRTNLPSHVWGSVGGRSLQFVSVSELEHYCLVGMQALDQLGPHPLEVVAQGLDGRQVILQTSLYVVSGDYERETIHFTPKVSELLDPQYTRPELLRLTEVYATFTPQVHWEHSFSWPCEGAITSHFGTRRRYGGEIQSYHAGIDIRGATGDPFYAPAPGVVVLAEVLKVRGGAVILDHGAGVLSGFYHLDDIGVEVGQSVEQGDVLGEIGSTGLSTGSHLHWELRVGGVAVDPGQWTERSFPR
ncbi:MAG: M23 family metallopeptidase [Anaerolineales bacterium]